MLWLADWSDSEDADFRSAFTEAGLDAQVVRGPALGTSVGRRGHRLRSWPTYAWLAAQGLARGRDTTVVAWQPLAGALAALLRPGRRPPIVVLNPLLSADGGGRQQRLVVAGLRRADATVTFTAASGDQAAALGVPRPRLHVIPLGVRARRDESLPPGGYLLAAGREHRDWDTLAAAAQGLGTDVVVLGPPRLPQPGPLLLRPPVSRPAFLALLEGAAALVVPLSATDRPAGQLAVLDAMSVGRAVVATRSPGTEGYVTDETGILVPPRDVDALRAALVRVSQPEVAASMGHAALRAAQGPFALTRFVSDVQRVALSLATPRR